MTDNKLDPEVMETFKKIKIGNQDRVKALNKIEQLNLFEREIGLPDATNEQFVTDTKINIEKVNRALKKRGL